VSAVCESLGIPHYLPLTVHRTVSGGKVNTFLLPMFPGYLFASLGEGDLLPLKQTHSVAQRIETRCEADLIKDLGQILTLEQSGLDLSTPMALQQGQRVMVRRGPLAGVTGAVVRYKNRNRLQVAIEAIQQAILLDVNREDLLPV